MNKGQRRSEGEHVPQSSAARMDKLRRSQDPQAQWRAAPCCTPAGQCRAQTLPQQLMGGPALCPSLEGSDSGRGVPASRDNSIPASVEPC